MPSKPLTGFLRGKTVAGSSAFFVVAAVIYLTTLSVYTDLPDWQIALCALVVATATSLAEAICRRGLDNLFVPLVAWFVLKALDLAAQPATSTAMDFWQSLKLLIGGEW